MSTVTITKKPIDGEEIITVLELKKEVSTPKKKKRKSKVTLDESNSIEEEVKVTQDS